jgi:dihydroorotate dehydrogenase (NAD+) catalytic subunit
MTAPEAPDLSTNLGGIQLRNPVLTASGTFGYGTELAPFMDLRRIGGLVAKSLTLEPRHGNPPPRIVETPAGMLNAISLENVGVQAFIEEKLPEIPEGVPVIASVFGTEIELYAEVCKRLAGAPKVVGIEVNASCPHVKSGGAEFGQDPVSLARLVRAVRRATSLPLLVKLSPNVTDIAEMARVCEGEGADGISAINTLRALVVDVETRRPSLSNGLGGLSGPAIRPVALRMVWQCARAVGIPVCGIGGICTAEDAIQFLLCGAVAIQVGTANFLNPMAAVEVVEGIEGYCARHGVERVSELIGAVEFPGL